MNAVNSVQFENDLPAFYRIVLVIKLSIICYNFPINFLGLGLNLTEFYSILDKNCRTTVVNRLMISLIILKTKML